MKTRSISIVLLCAAVLFTGCNAAVERRRAAHLLNSLSELFSELEQSVEKSGKSFLGSLAAVRGRPCAAAFSFLRGTLERFTDGADLTEIWRACVSEDRALIKTGAKNVDAVCSLADFFETTSPCSLACACGELSERFAEESARRREEIEKNERLILTGSVLGAAALFIIMI